MFTPEAAVLVFIFLLLFFVCLSFKPKRLTDFFLTVYFWRAGMEVVNKLYNQLVQTYFIGAIWNFSEETAVTEPSFFELQNLAYIKLAVALILFIVFYLISWKLLRPTQLSFHWLLTFLVLLSLTGFLVSSFLFLFSFEWEFYSQPIWANGFLSPSSQVIWLFLPLVTVVLANLVSQKFFRNVFRRVRIVRR